MKAGDYFRSKYISAADLSKPVKVTIERCVVETVGQGPAATERLVLYFRGAKRGLVLNRARVQNLVAITGSDDTDHWLGAEVVLYNDTTVEFQGRRGGTRIRGV